MSAPPTVPYSANPGEPSLADVLALHRKDVFQSLNSHHLGKVQAFDVDQQTCTATINYKQTIFVKGPAGQYVPRLLDYPLLVDCPAVILSGAGGSLTMGDLVGQDCLVLFNDRDIDNWFQGNSSTAPATSRLHSFSDGLILVGVRALAAKLGDYDPVRAVLRSLGGAKVGVGGGGGRDKVQLQNDSTTLLSLLNSLVSAINGATYGGFGIDTPISVNFGSLLE